jgi:hypothetical protein
MTMEAVYTSETSVHFNETTRRYIPEGCHLHTRRRGNLKSHTCCILDRLRATSYLWRVTLRHYAHNYLYFWTAVTDTKRGPKQC